MLQGLGTDYYMFTTVMLQPPMPKYSELISLLTSFVIKILNQNASLNRLHQAAYVAQCTNNVVMALNKKSSFSSQKRGFLLQALDKQAEQPQENSLQTMQQAMSALQIS